MRLSNNYIMQNTNFHKYIWMDIDFTKLISHNSIKYISKWKEPIQQKERL